MADKLEIIWSDQSIQRVDQVLKYLHDNWSEKEIENFLDAIEGFEEIVSRFPHVYPESQLLKGYRRAVLAKQISVLYSVHKTSIKVHTLFDNRQDPNKLK